jgi:hypothetical protein
MYRKNQSVVKLQGLSALGERNRYSAKKQGIKITALLSKSSFSLGY